MDFNFDEKYSILKNISEDESDATPESRDSAALVYGDTMSIVLDDFRFSIEAVNERYDKTRLHIHSLNLNTRIESDFLVYRANRKRTLWRLCLDIPGAEKDWDTIQSSTIDLRLQVFINEQLDRRCGFIPQMSFSDLYQNTTQKKIINQ